MATDQELVNDKDFENWISREVKALISEDILSNEYKRRIREQGIKYEQERDKHFEPMEYYFVGDRLGKDLKEANEVVINLPHNQLWCRQGTGYSLTQESVLQKIYQSLQEDKNET